MNFCNCPNCQTNDCPAAEDDVSKRLEVVWRWAVIENIFTMLIAFAGCWQVSIWFALLLLNLNYKKGIKTS